MTEAHSSCMSRHYERQSKKRASNFGSTVLSQRVNVFHEDRENSRIEDNQFHNQQIKRTWLNQNLSPDARISDDLLGAGIDPLKFDYNYSSLLSQTQQLFQKQFPKPKPAKIRHPGVIDKFERTHGAPQTGLKVSNSVILRIGANYNRFAKNLYLNVNTKSIMYVPKVPKIALACSSEPLAVSATEEEEYRYVLGKEPLLGKKV